MELFFEDSEKGVFATWTQLIDEIKNSTIYNPYCKSQSCYHVFKSIVLSMLTGSEIILLDSDFSDSELVSLTGINNFDSHIQVIKKEELPKIYGKFELIEKLKKTSNDWKITLFTSGTTGIPKKVTHDFNSITRFVKISTQNSNSIWGFAYNPTHMAGVQVFLQALLNGNSIINLFGLTQTFIQTKIKENHITHLSATPTFYRLLLPSSNTFEYVLRITFGGERFNEKSLRQFKEIFPNAKINNVYASTEAGTLFSSNDDVFTVKEEIEKLIRVENDELIIHKSLMGNSDLKITEWYNTGDLIDIITEKPLKFRFKSRKNDMINVGGYKVNPLEVEDAILSLPDIQNVRVYSKSNSVLGNIICCDVVCNNKQVNESSIRAYLQSKIQEYKIPRIIRFVDTLSITRTGKIKRN
jgi:acyl-coenzyme A synthetase/AMP-(fatty) acid ligase